MKNSTTSLGVKVMLYLVQDLPLKGMVISANCSGNRPDLLGVESGMIVEECGSLMRYVTILRQVCFTRFAYSPENIR